MEKTAEFFIKPRYRSTSKQRRQEEPEAETPKLPGINLPRMTQSPKLSKKRRRDFSLPNSRKTNSYSIATTEASNIQSLLDERNKKSKQRERDSREYYKYAVNRRVDEENNRRSASNPRMMRALKMNGNNRNEGLRASYDHNIHRNEKEFQAINSNSLGQKIFNLQKNKSRVEERRKSLKRSSFFKNSQNENNENPKLKIVSEDEKKALDLFKEKKGKIYENLDKEIKEKLKKIIEKLVVHEHTMNSERFDTFCKVVTDGIFQGIWMKYSKIVFEPNEINLTFPRKRKTLNFFSNFPLIFLF